MYISRKEVDRLLHQSRKRLGPLFEPVPLSPSGALDNHYEITGRETRGFPAPGAAETTTENLRSGTASLLPLVPGRNTASVRPSVARSRAERWLMLSALRDLIPAERASKCHRILLTDKTNLEVVPVKFSPSKTRSRYDNLNACGDIWACPVCSLRIAYKRSEQLNNLITNHLKSGGRLIHVVQTVQHTRDDDLKDLLARIATARQRMHASREFKALKAKYGYVGSIRALEVTHSNKNGWHPHTHELLLVNDSWYLSRFPEFKASYFALWQKYARKQGFFVSKDAFLFDIASDDSGSIEKISNYITRQISDHDYLTTEQEKEFEDQLLKNDHRNENSTAAKELALSALKMAKTESRSHMQLLRDFALDGDMYAGALFFEFVEAFRNKRQLIYSDGLKAKYGVIDNDNQELAESGEYDEQILGTINKVEWWAIINTPRARGNILTMTDSGTWEGVPEYIEKVLLEYWERKERLNR